MQAIVNLLRRRKKHTIWCNLDDYIMLGRSWHKAFCQTLEFLRLLIKLVLEIHYWKSVLSPTQCLVWIGFELISVQGRIEVPRTKLKSVV